jgi:formamidopyrimidine-DNA glycosylase
MIELPEAQVISRQMSETLTGKSIAGAVAGQSPHTFAWYYGDPRAYPALLVGKTIEGAESFGGYIQIWAGEARIAFGEGANLRFHPAGEKRPAKHQLLVEFADGSALSATVQMYAWLWAFPAGRLDNPYYLGALQKPSPLSPEFTRAYFDQMMFEPGAEKLSAKALLATNQRIPGLGSGVLQDILYTARIHPKRKAAGFTTREWDALFQAIPTVLHEMARCGGRDTEKDLFGKPGGYPTKMSKNTAGSRCAACDSLIQKEAYLGGSIYYCPGCQPV